MSLFNNPLFISWIGIIICTILGSLLYVYRPYYYVIAYAILCMGIGTLGMTNTSPTMWTIVILSIYMVCIISSIIYFNYKVKPTISILVVSIVIYIFTNRLFNIIYNSNKPFSNNTIQSIHALLVLILFGIVTAIIHLVIHPPSEKTLSSIYTYLTIIGICFGILFAIWIYMYTTIQHVYILIFITCIALVIFLAWYILKKKHYNSFPSSFLINTPTSITPSRILVTDEQFNKIRNTPYKYSIIFDLLILPGIGTNKDVSIIRIDNNIDIRYNNATGILSIWGWREGYYDFNMLYGNYIIPLQKWTSILINVLDGKVDLAINNVLKMSTNILLKNQYRFGNIRIGDGKASWIKGYIQNIHISNTMYII